MAGLSFPQPFGSIMRPVARSKNVASNHWGTAVSGSADNHIEEVMQGLSDGGGIYTLGRQPGTELHHNLITGQRHHTAGSL